MTVADAIDLKGAERSCHILSRSANESALSTRTVQSNLAIKLQAFRERMISGKSYLFIRLPACMSTTATLACMVAVILIHFCSLF